MSELQKEKIRRFLADPVMYETIRGVITRTFLKPKGEENVQLLAAERIAINLLEEAFKELERHKAEEDKDVNKLKQVGL